MPQFSSSKASLIHYKILDKILKISKRGNHFKTSPPNISWSEYIDESKIPSIQTSSNLVEVN